MKLADIVAPVTYGFPAGLRSIAPGLLPPAVPPSTAVNATLVPLGASSVTNVPLLPPFAGRIVAPAPPGNVDAELVMPVTNMRPWPSTATGPPLPGTSVPVLPR